MSDDDAQRIVDAGSGETPELSPEAMGIVTEATTSCASSEDLLNSIIEALPEGIDGDCVRDKLSGVDLGDIVSSGTMPPEVDQAMSDCGTG